MARRSKVPLLDQNPTPLVQFPTPSPQAQTLSQTADDEMVMEGDEEAMEPEPMDPSQAQEVPPASEAAGSDSAISSELGAFIAACDLAVEKLRAKVMAENPSVQEIQAYVDVERQRAVAVGLLESRTEARIAALEQASMEMWQVLKELDVEIKAIISMLNHRPIPFGHPQAGNNTKPPYPGIRS